MAIIDAHTHCWPDALAPRVIDTLAPKIDIDDRPVADGTMRGLIEQMDEAGIDRCIVLPVATKPTQVDTINGWLLPYLDSERVIPFAAIHPDMDHPKERIDALAAAGFRGIKLHTLSQRFRPQEERMFPFYETAIDNDLIMTFHTGAGLEYPDIYGSPSDFDEFFERFPYEKTVLAHLGGTRTVYHDPIPAPNRPGYLDLAWLIGNCSDASLLECVRTHGVDRVLFATDSPWKSMKHDVEYLGNVGFSPDELEAIFHGNAVRLLGLEV